MPAYDAFFSHVVVSHNVQIGNVKLIDETTGRISNNLVSVADVNKATLNAFSDGQLSNIDDAISLINLKLGDVQELWEPVYYPNDNQITIMNLTSYLRNLHNEFVTIQSNTDLTPLVSNIDINREQLGNLQTNFINLKSIVIGKDGDDTTTTPGLVNRVGLLEAAVGNIQMDVDLTPLVSNIDINREQLGNLRGNVTNLESVVLPGLVGNVTALQSSVTDIRGDNPDSSINLSLLYGIILDLQSKMNVLKDPFSVQVVSSTTTEIKMRLQGRSLGDITVNIGGQIFKIINYDGNYELLVTGLQPTTIYDVTVNSENLSFTYDIQMTTI